jgi:hypothetical protein
VAKFLDQRGPGLHHVSFEVPDLPSALRARAAGVRLVDERPRASAHGTAIGSCTRRASAAC